MCSNEPSTTFTVQEADGASRINHQHVLGRDIDPQPDPNEVCVISSFLMLKIRTYLDCFNLKHQL